MYIYEERMAPNATRSGLVDLVCLCWLYKIIALFASVSYPCKPLVSSEKGTLGPGKNF
jgi:hypothetical protein